MHFDEEIGFQFWVPEVQFRDLQIQGLTVRDTIIVLAVTTAALGWTALDLHVRTNWHIAMAFTFATFFCGPCSS